MNVKNIAIRFYEELNDFLPIEKRKVTFIHTYRGNPNVKDIIESLGVPHTEVDLILVNGLSVDFTHKLKSEDQVSIYPVFEALDITPLLRLRAKPLRRTKFILDVHLGRLAKYLRLFGFDTLYDNDSEDLEIIEIAKKERRIILTRDIGLLKNKIVTHGYWVRNTNPKEQLVEILHKFDLVRKISPFSRCLECNHLLRQTNKKNIQKKLQTDTRKYYENFSQCVRCKKIYWEGSHYEKMKLFVNDILAHLPDL